MTRAPSAGGLESRRGEGSPTPPAASLGQVLADELPITQSLGIAVREASAGRVVLTLPLAANRNHKGTVFAGSLNAAATLAGWGALWQSLQDAGVAAHVVIQDGTTRYLAPARTDVLAECLCPPAEVMQPALAQLARRGRARVRLEVVVRDAAGDVVASLHARYVLQRRSS